MTFDGLRDLTAKMKYYLQLHCYKSVAMEVLRNLMNYQFTKVSTITVGISRSNYYMYYYYMNSSHLYSPQPLKSQ